MLESFALKQNCELNIVDIESRSIFCVNIYTVSKISFM